MRISTPGKIEQVAWEGDLEPIGQTSAARSTSSSRSSVVRIAFSSPVQIITRSLRVMLEHQEIDVKTSLPYLSRSAASIPSNASINVRASDAPR